MSKSIYLSSTVLIFCAFFYQNSLAQVAPGDSSSQRNALNNAVALYNTTVGIQVPIYSGPEYYFYDPHIKGNGYYLDVNTFSKGSVLYDGTMYNNITMLYDINTDELIGLFPNRISKFIVLKERVRTFDYIGSHFINITVDTAANKPPLEPGFYRQLYSGKSEVLGKYTKSIQTNTSTSTYVEDYFTEKKYFYIRKNDVFHDVRSKGSVLDLYKDKKNELKKFIKTENLDFKERPEEAMVKVATWYDHLSN